MGSATVQAEKLIVSVIRIKGWRLFHPIVGFIVFEHILKTPQVIWEHLEKLLVQRNKMNMLS